MKKFSAREIRRLQQRVIGNLGLDLEELGKADEVIIRLQDKEITIKGPSVLGLKMEKERVYQIVGGEVLEEAPVTESKAEEERPSIEIIQEDVYLISMQTGVSEEEARRVLLEVGGDIAKAILILKSSKK